MDIIIHNPITAPIIEIVRSRQFTLAFVNRGNDAMHPYTKEETIGRACEALYYRGLEKT